MATLHGRYYNRWSKDRPKGDVDLESGFNQVKGHPIMGNLLGEIYPRMSHLNGSEAIACVTRSGDIYVNTGSGLSANEWAYALAHCLLHLAFGHFDKEKIPVDLPYVPGIWNKACDIYVARFLSDIGFGDPVVDDPAEVIRIKQNDEYRIYEYLLKTGDDGARQDYGLNTAGACDMFGLEAPVTYKKGEENPYVSRFSYAVTHSVRRAVSEAAEREYDAGRETVVTEAAEWFMRNYPLLGGLAASFKIIEDAQICQQSEIRMAAVDVDAGEIYVNPAAGLTGEEWKFVLAHEYLHAGLSHRERCQGRDFYLWNVACDFVVNGWLVEMGIGEMPQGDILYDETLKGMSAEAIYDLILKQMRRVKKHATFRGYGKGDILKGAGARFEGIGNGMTLDEHYRNSLREGLDFQKMRGRGYLPAGLVEEIRALSMPPIPWEVELARWFDIQFPQMERHRSYARPSRRQAETPDIPRPRYIIRETDMESRTFGVVVDTSGSMSVREIGQALGAIASYAVSKDVPFVRLVFCDAEATDAGYLSPEDIAGRVKVTGRGGTMLQPGVDALINAKDFPKTGPILIITDGVIESDLKVKREHAFLLPKGCRLPFKTKGKVFHFAKK